MGFFKSSKPTSTRKVSDASTSSTSSMPRHSKESDSWSYYTIEDAKLNSGSSKQKVNQDEINLAKMMKQAQRNSVRISM